MPRRPLPSASVSALPPATGGERLLIVAPHMDDETIAAGGLAIDAIARGADVSVVFLTAGDCNRSCARFIFRTWNPTADQYLAIGRRRIREARAATHTLGVAVDRVFVLGYPDQGLASMLVQSDGVASPSTGRLHVPYDDAVTPGAEHTRDNLVDDLARVCEAIRPTTVIAPAHFDVHPDHRAAAEIVTLALSRSAIVPERLGYLVHQSRYIKSFVWQRDGVIAPPEHLRDLAWTSHGLNGRTVERKNDVLQHYESQRPYLTLLRNAFVRSNELFFDYAADRVVTREIEEDVVTYDDEALATSS